MLLGKLFHKAGNVFYFIFRIFVGFLFFQHGAQKLLGWFTDNDPVALFSLMGAAGLIESIGGLFIILGLFTRLVSLIAGIEMIVAYFMAHIPNGFIPIQNGGELALLYLASYILMLAYGPGKWDLEKALFKKEIF